MKRGTAATRGVQHYARRKKDVEYLFGGKTKHWERRKPKPPYSSHPSWGLVIHEKEKKRTKMTEGT